MTINNLLNNNMNKFKIIFKRDANFLVAEKENHFYYICTCFLETALG